MTYCGAVTAGFAIILDMPANPTTPEPAAPTTLPRLVR